MTDGMGVTRRTRQRQTQPPPKQAAKECLGHAYDPSTRAGASLPSSNRPRVLRRGACRCELTRGEEKKKTEKNPTVWIVYLSIKPVGPRQLLFPWLQTESARRAFVGQDVDTCNLEN